MTFWEKASGDADLERMPDLHELPGFLFRVLENKSNSLFQAALRDRTLTTRQFGVLLTLVRDGPMTQTELAERSASDKSTMGEMIGRMKARSLITRVRGTDKRAIVIDVTPEGSELLREVVPQVMAVQDALLEALPVEYRMLFMKCLLLLHDAKIAVPATAEKTSAGI